MSEDLKTRLKDWLAPTVFAGAIMGGLALYSTVRSSLDVPRVPHGMPLEHGFYERPSSKEQYIIDRIEQDYMMQELDDRECTDFLGLYEAEVPFD